MARPQKDGIDYFPHDTNSFSDLKIKMLRAVHGNDGYAFYFYLLEQIYQQHDFVLDLSDDNTCDDIIACYCLDLGIQKEKFNEILKTCIKYGLFDKELYNSDKKLTSNGIQKRAKTVIDKRKDNAERYNKKKSKTVSESETDSLRSVSGVVSESETNFSGVVSGKFSGVSDSKEKESKEKESKEKESKENHHQKDSKIRFADDCDCVADDDDDDFDEIDLKTDDDENIQEEPKDEARAILLDQGIGGETAKTILNKFNPEYIEFKIKQILELNKSGSIKNLKAYILKSFANTDQDTADNELCAFLSEERRKEEARKPKMNPELERMKKQQEQDEKFIQETELLVLNATEKDKQTFIETVIEPSNMYKQSFNRGGFDNGFINVLFRTFLQNKYMEAK